MEPQVCNIQLDDLVDIYCLAVLGSEFVLCEYMSTEIGIPVIYLY